MADLQELEDKNLNESTQDTLLTEEELVATKKGQVERQAGVRTRTPEFPFGIDVMAEELIRDHFERLSEGLAEVDVILDGLERIEKDGELQLGIIATVTQADVDRWITMLVTGSHDSIQAEYYQLSEERRRINALPPTYDLPREQLDARAELYDIEFSSLRSRLPGVGKKHLEDIRIRIYEVESDMLAATQHQQDIYKMPNDTKFNTPTLLPDPEIPVESVPGKHYEILQVESPQEVTVLVEKTNANRQANKELIEKTIFGNGEQVSLMVERLAEVPIEQREVEARKMIAELLDDLGVKVDNSDSQLARLTDLEDIHSRIRALIGRGTFRNPSLVSETLPILYMDEQDEADLQQRADRFRRITGRALWGFHYSEEQERQGEITAAEMIASQRGVFVSSILLGETPFIHTTPVLERIVRAGALKAKQMINRENRHNNMNPVRDGAHSNLIHFCPDTFNRYWYQVGDDKDIYKSKRNPEQMEYQGGVVVPLSALVETSPISMHGGEAFGTQYVTIVLPEDLDDLPADILARIQNEEGRLSDVDLVTDNTGISRELDWAFSASEDPAQAAAYEYPLDRAYILTTDLGRTRQDLLEQGRTDEWISQHVLVLPSDLRTFGLIGNETEFSKTISERERSTQSRRTLVVPIRRIATTYNEMDLYQYRR